MNYREDWLNQLANKYLLPHLHSVAHFDDPKFRVSIGFPKASRGGKSQHAIGQCWSPMVSADKTAEIFVSPVLTANNAPHVLLHELVHAIVGNAHGHKGAFKKLALAAGLTGPMTATHASDTLQPKINKWLASMPAFPGAAMTPQDDPDRVRPGSRLVKCQCSQCGYTVRTTDKWLSFGSPVCPVNNIPMTVHA